jgi:hypothetical protein
MVRMGLPVSPCRELQYAAAEAASAEAWSEGRPSDQMIRLSGGRAIVRAFGSPSAVVLLDSHL